MILKRTLIIGLLLSSTLIKGQTSMGDLGPNPIYFFDSVRVSSSFIMRADATQVTLFTIVSGKDALKTIGDEAKDGVIYVETINFVKRRYRDYFRSRTKDSKLIKKMATYQAIQFILDESPLDDKDVGRLHTVNDETLHEFKIIGKKELKKKYKIQNRDYGIWITTK